MSAPAIETAGLIKTFGDNRAVDGVDLTVPSGTVYGLLGPNGAGKTTVVRVLATLLRPDGGSARVFGHDVAAEPDEVRRRVSLTGQSASVDEDLTGTENLVLLARLLGYRKPHARERAAQLLDAFGLTEAAGRQVKKYSGGMRRRLDIAASILNTPDLLFLDEPTTGLDPRSRNQVWDIVRLVVANGTTVLLTTQYLDEADQLAGRIAVIDHGRVIAEGTPGSLKASIGAGTVHVRLRDAARRPEAERLLTAALGSAVRLDADPVAMTARVDAGGSGSGGAELASRALSSLAGAGIVVDDFSLGQPSLDEVFLALTAYFFFGGGMTEAYTPSAPTLAAVLSRVEKPPRPSALSASLTFGWRAMLKIKHVPEQLFDVTAFPIIMTLMFTYLFGGALAGSTGNYLQFFLPGIMVTSVVMITMYTGVGLNTDIEKGVFDRFRTLPVWRPSALVGMIFGDVLRYILAATTIMLIGLILGFRPAGGAPGVIAGVGLLVVFSFAFSWVWTMFGLFLRSEKSVMSVSMLVLFPLTFLSNVFVDPRTMPGWLQAFVEVNPISHLVAAVRSMMAGSWDRAEVTWTLIASAALVVIFGTLSMRLYNRK